MKHLFAALVLSLFPLILFADTFVLTAQQWAVPRDASTVIRMPAMQSLYNAIEREPSGRVRIRYPGGDEGSLWAHEVRAWLVALGIPSAQLELIPGSHHADAVEFEVSGGASPSRPVIEDKVSPVEQPLVKGESRL